MKVWRGRRTVQHVHSFYSKPCFCNGCTTQFSAVLLKDVRSSFKNMLSAWKHAVLWFHHTYEPQTTRNAAIWTGCWSEADWSMSICLTTGQFFTLSRSVLNERWPREGDMFTYVFFLINLHLWIAWCVHDVFLTVKSPWAHAVISLWESCLFSIHCCLRTQVSIADLFSFFGKVLRDFWWC